MTESGEELERQTERESHGTYHCNDCGNGYDGYHYCDAGPDKVEYVCSDCGEHQNRETNQIDIEGMPPGRCVSCTFDRMAEP
jgi:DNA-directed RNA polymerase subunit RPC12/RpoP